MVRNKKKDFFIIIYLFLAIFEPPLLPVSFIYVMGAITVVLFLLRYGFVIRIGIAKKSKIMELLGFFLIMFGYLMIVTLIDGIFIEHADLLSNRLRCINQLIVLSFIEFINIWYFLILTKENNYSFQDGMDAIIKAGALQGICAVLAYTVPGIRNLFVRFGDSALFSNEYFIERRGYGFSMTLIDTFGYGMGLIAGYIILVKWKKKGLWRYLALVLVIFSIFVNARTGIVIFAIALILKILQGENKLAAVVKILIAIPILYLVFNNVIPEVLRYGIQSSNITIKWVATDFYEFYELMFKSGGASSSITDASFLSNFTNLPSNAFEFIFGSGHSIYDTSSQLGFRTDIGYLNLIWEFGIVGSIVLLVGMFRFIFKPFLVSTDTSAKSIALLNVASYAVVLLKAILIGYNPGVFINYLVTFMLYLYFCRKENSLPAVYVRSD